MWLVFAVLLHARFRPAMRGRSVMVLTIVAFAFLVFTWVGVEALRLPTAHGATGTSSSRKDRDAVRLLALGVDHRSAPAAVREALAFDGPKYGEGLGLFAEAFPGNEFVILSTCNRVELYVAGGAEQVPEVDALTDFLVRVPRRRRRGRSPGTWSATTTRGSSATCSGSRPAWRAWSWARGRSSARSARRIARPSTARRSARSSTRCSRRRFGSASWSASRPAWTRGSCRSPASRSTWPGRSSTRSPTRPCW